MVLTPGDTVTAGAVLLAAIAVAYGGTFLLRVHAGHPPTNDLQKAFFRAGHAHAGVLVILGLVIKILTGTEGVRPLAQQLSDGVLYAAILMPDSSSLSPAATRGSPTGCSSCCGSGPPRSPSAWSLPESA